jgi:hypothetical protein
MIADRILIEEDDPYYNYELTKDDKVTQIIHLEMIGNKKPELLIDETTQAYLEDPTNMFNLTLSRFPKSDGIYLGRVFLGDYDIYKNAFNLRIDYYVMGYTPTLQIKAFNCVHDEIFDLKITNRKMIKDVIRICNQSQRMVIN